MAQATHASTPQNLSVQQAAAAIVQLINSTPRTPWLSEIEAVIAKAVPSTLGSGDYAVVRSWDAAEAAHFAVAARNGEASEEEHTAATDACMETTRLIWEQPVRGWPDIVARAKIALYWRWPRYDNGEVESYQALLREADDLDDGPLAQLIHAILTLEGGRRS